MNGGVIEHNIVVRNTFIDVQTVRVHDDYVAPPRTISDPTCYGEKLVAPLKTSLSVKEGTRAEEDGHDEPANRSDFDPTTDVTCAGQGFVKHEVDDEDDEDDGALSLLSRTVSSGYPYPTVGSDYTNVVGGSSNLARTTSSGYPREADDTAETVLRALVGPNLPQAATIESKRRPAAGACASGNETGMLAGSGAQYVSLTQLLSGEAVADGGAIGPAACLVPVAVPMQYAGMPAGVGLQPWGVVQQPYGAYGAYGSVMQFPQQQMAVAGVQPPGPVARERDKDIKQVERADGQQVASPSAWRPPMIGIVQERLPAGCLHTFHPETTGMGVVGMDFREFTKIGYEGRLSVVSENQVHLDGCHRYLVQFTSGELSRADGVGFVFSPRLPCAKNIQRIVSIFVNKGGRICMRVFADIVRASAYVKPIELGDWVDMTIDLNKKVANFKIWPNAAMEYPGAATQPISMAEFPFGNKLGHLYNQGSQKNIKLNMGHLACVVKNVGVTITLAS